jgi:hypothetical protein
VIRLSGSVIEFEVIVLAVDVAVAVAVVLAVRRPDPPIPNTTFSLCICRTPQNPSKRVQTLHPPVSFRTPISALIPTASSSSESSESSCSRQRIQSRR